MVRSRALFFINNRYFFSLSVSAERNMLASCGEDGLINIWDLSKDDGTPIKTLKPFQHPLTKRKEKYLSSSSVIA